MSKEIEQEVFRLKDLTLKLKTNGKITVSDKKLFLSQISQILTSVKIREYLNDCSLDEFNDSEMDDDEKPKLTWKSLYRDLFFVVNQEFVKFRSAREKQTKNLPSVETFSCFKTIIFYGLTCENVLKSNDVCKFLIEILDDDVIAPVHFNDVTQIVIDGILNNSNALCRLSHENFENLFGIYVDILKKDPENSAENTCVEALKNFITRGISQFQFNYRQLLVDFGDVIENTDKNSSSSYVMNLLACVNVITKSYAFEDRRAFCEFGERISQKMLSFVKKNGSESNVLEFFADQMILHHPGNVFLPYDGAIVDEEWKSVVKTLYCLLYEIFKASSSKLSINAMLKQIAPCIELFARVLLQTFYWGEEIEDVPSRTQTNATTTFFGRKRVSASAVEATQRKRLCIEINWTSFVQNLDKNLNSLSLYPWLLVVRTVLCKFFSVVEPTDLSIITKFMLSLLNSSKRPEILKITIEMAENFVEQLKKRRKVVESEHEAFLFSVYDVAVRLTCVKNVQNELFGLLSSIISLELIDSQRAQSDLCRIFDTYSCAPSSNSCRYLFSFLRHYEFSEKWTNFMTFSDDLSCDEYRFRSFLIQWLMRRRNAYDDDLSSGSYKIFASVTSHVLAANLRQICAKQPCRLRVPGDDDEGKNCKMDLEKFYVELGFSNTNLDVKNDFDEERSSLSVSTDSSVNLVMNCVIRSLSQIFDDITDNDTGGVDALDVAAVNSAFVLGVYVSIWFRSTFVGQLPEIFQRFEVKLLAVYDALCRHFMFAECSNEVKKDFVEKIFNILKLVDRDEFRRFGEETEFSRISSVLSLSTNIISFENRKNSDESPGNVDDKTVGSKTENDEEKDLQLKVFRLLTFMSSYPDECSLKMSAEKLLFETLTRLTDAKDNCLVDKAHFTNFICSVCQNGFENIRCTVEFAKTALTLVKNILDEDYENFATCEKLLRACCDLPKSTCFRDSNVREKYFRILFGFKKILDHLKLTSNVKTILFRCLITLEKHVAGFKVCMSENNNSVDYPVRKLILDVFNGGDCSGCLEFNEICLGIKELTESRREANDLLEILFENLSKVAELTSTKIYCFIRALIDLMKHSPNFHAICVFYFCQICKHSKTFAQFILKSLQSEKTFNTREIKEIFDVNLKFCIHQCAKTFKDDDWDKFPFELWNFTSYDDFFKQHFAHFASVCKLNSDERLKILLERILRLKLDDVVSRCAPEVFVGYLSVVESTSALKQFKNAVRVDLQRFVKENFCVVLKLLSERITFDKDLILPGEISEQNFTQIVNSLLHLISCESLTEMLLGFPKDVILDVSLWFRTNVCSKTYTSINFKRFFCFINLLNSRLFGLLTSFVVRETLLTIKFVLSSRSDSVDRSVFPLVLRICQKLYEEVAEPVEIAKFLFYCWTEKSFIQLADIPLLPAEFKRLSELRNIQIEFRKTQTFSLAQDVDRVLATPDNLLTIDDLVFLLSNLGTSYIDVSSMSKIKVLSLMKKCLSLSHTKQFVLPVARLVAYFCRRGFTFNVVPACDPPREMRRQFFVEVSAGLDKEIQSENAERAILAVNCLKEFLSHEIIHDFLKSSRSRLTGKEIFIDFLSFLQKVPSGKSNKSNLIFDDRFWNINKSSASFDEWIVEFFANFLSNSNFSEQVFYPLKTLCEQSAHFCKTLFPCVFESIVMFESPNNRIIVGESFNKLFQNLLETSEILLKNNSLTKFVSLFLSVINRIKYFDEKLNGLLAYQLFEIDYLILAQLCCRVGFWTESIMFLEIAAEKFRTNAVNCAVHVDKSKKNILSFLNEPFASNLAENFARLNNLDAIYGLGELVLSKPCVRSYLWKSEKEWSRAVSFYSSLDQTDNCLLQQAAFAIGLNENLVTLNLSNDELTSYRCQCAMQLGSWDSVEISKRTPKNFYQYVYDVICDEQTMAASKYLVEVGTSLISRDATTDDFETFVKKACLLDEAFSCVKTPSPIVLSNELISQWSVEASETNKNNNEVDQLIQSFRWGVLHRNLSKLTRENFFVEAVTCFANITERRIDWFRSQKMPSVAIKLATEFQARLETLKETLLPIGLTFVGRLKQIEILWESGEQFLALSKLNLLNDKAREMKQTNESQLLLAKILLLLGEFKTKLESPESADNCFNEAASVLEKLLPNNDDQVVQNLCSVYAAMARYADESYQLLTDYINSSSFASKKGLIQKLKLLDTGRPLADTVKQGKEFLSLASKKSSIDQSEVDDIVNTQQDLMQAAVAFYLRCLSMSNKYDLKIFRVISLWFDNFDSISLANNFTKFASEIPTYKWLLVWTQLTSRLSLNKKNCPVDPFVETVYEIVEKTSLDHPFHTFYTLFSLAHGTSSKSDADGESKKLRAEAAKNLIKRLRNSHLAGVFTDLERLACDYVEIGSLKTANLDKRKKHAIPKACSLLKYNATVPVVTIDLKIQPSAKYRNFIGIVRFEPYFTVASGKSSPVVVYCVCSDGKIRKQIVKGHDDTRQDAIMEQAFGVVNMLLQDRKNVTSSDCSISRMRTYNVIPLTPDCGVIEWCEGAVSFGDYLIGSDGKGGAHERIYPNDSTGLQCRLEFANANKSNYETKRKTYVSICEKFQPVFRHFFYENFAEPIDWYEARENYTRSVAISSMVGHVLGLSDRHPQNMLVDQTTAELIQIDLGMAFEQGRILPTPEQVPFRLTRDIIDGMGVTGVEGVFRRICEHVMTVLRDSTDVLIPIVSVLLHDPVSDWVLNDVKIRKVQAELAVSQAKSQWQNKNEHAERAILKVMDKLKGLEKTAILTIEGQVAYLISQASDPSNLCQMYHGWQPYL